jgi:hypothetical protein
MQPALWTGQEAIFWGGGGPWGGAYCASNCAATTWYKDADADGYGNPSITQSACLQPATYVANSGDCNDASAGVNPGASDATCDGIDQNCSGPADEGYVPVPTACGVGACARTGSLNCVAGNPVDTCAPGAPVMEVCDNVDNDCDGSTDEGFDPDEDGVASCFDNCPSTANPLQEDFDNDGFGDACDFTLVAPANASVFARTSSPATFTWLPQDKTKFQVQWATSNSPFTALITSSATLQPGTSFTPTLTVWRQILKLGKNGQTVYWRVLGRKAPAPAVPSDQVFTFTVTP